MALERQLHLLRRHPHSVVHHPDQPAAGVLQVHLHPPGAGVPGVFQELLEHRGGGAHAPPPRGRARAPPPPRRTPVSSGPPLQPPGGGPPPPSHSPPRKQMAGESPP